MQAIFKLFLVLIILSCFGCSNNNSFDFSQLEGEWRDSKAQYLQVEKWTMNQEHNLDGIGLGIEQSDTVFIEELHIIMENGVMTYFAHVEDQNGGRTVPFPMKSETSNQVKFVNEDHDFPQRIVYTFSGKDSLHVVVGQLSSNEKDLHFHFARKEMGI